LFFSYIREPSILSAREMRKRLQYEARLSSNEVSSRRKEIISLASSEKRKNWKNVRIEQSFTESCKGAAKNLMLNLGVPIALEENIASVFS